MNHSGRLHERSRNTLPNFQDGNATLSKEISTSNQITTSHSAKASTIQCACRRIGDGSDQEADTHATRPKLTPLVQTSVYSIQGKTTFTSHEVRALRTSIPTKNIKKYLLGRHNWDEKIFHSIAWEAYASSAIRSIDANMHTFVVKFCDWLPVAQRLVKYGNTYDHCSSCPQHESYGDIFCCQSRNK
jgi:hypothetical protein